MFAETFSSCTVVHRLVGLTSRSEELESNTIRMRKKETSEKEERKAGKQREARKEKGE